MTVTKTIGTGGGRDYATIEAWEADTSTSLTQVNEGHVYHDGVAGDPTYTMDSTASRIVISGATNLSGARFRRLQAAAANHYDPVLKTGVWIKRKTNGATEALREFMSIAEARFQLWYIAVLDDPQLGPTSGLTDMITVESGATNVRINSCYVGVASQWSDGTAGTATGSGIRFIGDNFKCYNTIVEGGGARGNRGANYGIRVDGTARGEVLGCTAIDIAGWDENSPAACRGISGNNVAYIYNCIAVHDLAVTSGNQYAFDFVNVASNGSQGLVSSDTSAQYAFGAELKNAWNIVASELFVSPVNHDWRLLSTAPAQDWDNLQYLYTQFSLISDYYGNTRSTVYADLGAYGGAPVTASEAPPTTVISTVGSGGTYATLALWESNTAVNLITDNLIHIAEIIGDLSTTLTHVTIKGAITDATHYREIRPQAGNEYAPSADSGCTLSTTGTETDIAVVVVDEKFFRLTGPIKLTQTGAGNDSTEGAGGVVRVELDADNVRLDGLWITSATTAASMSFFNGILLKDSSQKGVIQNCVIWGSNGVDNKGIYGGIRIRGAGTECKIYNCSVYGTKTLASAGTQVGIWIDSSPDCTVRNCAVADALTDFNLAAGTTRTNNISSDTTATGTDSQISKSAITVWVDAPARNYYLVAGTSPASEAGYDTGVLLDALGNGRYTPFDVGAVEGSKPYPRFPAVTRRTRVCTGYEIIRTDGVRLRLTDSCTPITVMGSVWSPMSLDASARRRELGMKAADVEAGGAITSDKITQDDLRAGRYQGAALTEYLFDWRYPHLKPYAETRFQIESTTFSGEHWEAKIKGLPFVLQTKVGGSYSRTCGRVLGDEKCLATFTTQSGKTVLDTVDTRRIVYLDAAELSVTTTNYFALGKLTWLTGLNAKIISELFSSEVLAVNKLANPNLFTSWTAANAAITVVTDGYAAGVDSFLFARNATATPGGATSASVGTWATVFPAPSKLCLSVQVKRPASTPAEYCAIEVFESASTEVIHRAQFFWDGSAWTHYKAEDEDPGISVVITNSGSWWRLSLGMKTNGQETANVQARLLVGVTGATETNEDLEFSQAQLEIDTLTPTTWTTANKHKLVFAIPTPLAIAAGDTFDLAPGCDKLRATCRDKFTNIKNFRAYPFIPGTDKMLDTPIQ